MSKTSPGCLSLPGMTELVITKLVLWGYIYDICQKLCLLSYQQTLDYRINTWFFAFLCSLDSCCKALRYKSGGLEISSYSTNNLLLRELDAGPIRKEHILQFYEDFKHILKMLPQAVKQEKIKVISEIPCQWK